MQYDWLGDLKHLLACPEQIETFAAQFAARVAAPQGGGASEDRAVTAPDGSGSLTTRITALIAQFDELPEDLQDVARNFPESKALLAWLTKAASAPAQAGEAVACADCAAGHPRYFVPSNGETIHALPGGTVSHCVKPDTQPAAERAVVERAAFEAWYDRNRDDGPNMVLSHSMAEKAWFARAALAEAEAERAGTGAATAAEVRAAAREEDAAGLIAAERRRQVESEGWTKEHDDEHDDQELARAAACYATPVYLRPVCKPPPEWPWDDEWWKPTQTNRVRELTKAGALIAAEIDRLLRARSKPA